MDQRLPIGMEFSISQASFVTHSGILLAPDCEMMERPRGRETDVSSFGELLARFISAAQIIHLKASTLPNVLCSVLPILPMSGYSASRLKRDTETGREYSCPSGF